MGELSIHSLDDFVGKFNCKIYVETGTGIGEALGHALKYGFDEYHTVDLDKEKVAAARIKFVAHDVQFENDFSTKALKRIVPALDKDKSVLFFLDAHFPDADFNGMSYDDSIKTYKREALPLEDEIRIITENRDTSKDCFVIDDWKLYDKDKKELNLGDPSDSILGIFKDSHDCNIDLRHQGFLFVTPKLNE